VVFAAACTNVDDLSWFLNELEVPTSLRTTALKLNLCDYRRGDSGATTSLEFVGLLVAALRKHCPDLNRVVLTEHDSSGTRAQHLFDLLGFSDFAAHEGCELFTAADASWRRVDAVGGLPISLPEMLFEVDLMINVPKLKFHGRTAYTGALKNNFGLVKRKWKVPYHSRLCETIVASNKHLPNQLVLVDGLTTLSGRGPAFGIPVRSGVAIGSWDPVAADWAGAQLLGIPSIFLSHVEMASRAGIGSNDPQIVWRSIGESKFTRPHFDWGRFLLTNALRRG
jgi:uncharacterized protein (DUF362 family)